jgi:hypothetical protein
MVDLAVFGDRAHAHAHAAALKPLGFASGGEAQTMTHSDASLLVAAGFADATATMPLCARLRRQ